MTIGDVPRLKDVARAEPVDPGWFPPEPFVRRIVERGSGFGVVVQRLARAGDASPIYGFGVSAFIRPECVLKARQFAESSSGGRFAHELDADADLLSEAELPPANSGAGLSILAYGGRADTLLDPAGRVECAALYTKGFVETHYGYNIQQYLFIVVNPYHKALLGFAGAAALGPDDQPNPPWLMGLGAREGRQANGSIFPVLFHTRRPLVRLSSSQRELVLLALDGVADSEAGALLGVTGDAIKKRWSSIFDLVTERCPDLLPSQKDDGRRGPEKRTRLLEYLRDHVEELRPWA